jgi:hypothetical protein
VKPRKFGDLECNYSFQKKIMCSTNLLSDSELAKGSTLLNSEEASKSTIVHHVTVNMLIYYFR